MEFDAVRPAGARTCCAVAPGSAPATHTWLDQDVPEFGREFEQLQNGTLEPRLSKREHLDALGVLQAMRASAAAGRLSVGSTNTFPVRTITTTNYLLELRPRFSRGNPPRRLVRLYYAEPATVDAALLPLAVATKENGPDVAEEQNTAIGEATVRSRSWQLLNMMGSGG